MLDSIQAKMEFEQYTKSGLAALSKNHRKCIKLTNYKPDCSLKLDDALAHAFNELYAQDNRWDYYVYVMAKKNY